MRDLNGDGVLDLLYYSNSFDANQSGTVHALIQGKTVDASTGTGTFTDVSTALSGISGWGTFLSNVVGDVSLDLLSWSSSWDSSTNSYRHVIQAFEGNTTGSFSTSATAD